MLKTVSVESVMQDGFAVAARIGEHQLMIDQPVTAKGTGLGPTPLQMLLFAVGGCIATIGRIAAFQRKIALHGMRITVEGDYDPDALMGKATTERVGFQQIRILAEIDADLSVEQKQRFLDEVCARCPLHDNLLTGTQVAHQLVSS